MGEHEVHTRSFGDLGVSASGLYGTSALATLSLVASSRVGSSADTDLALAGRRDRQWDHFLKHEVSISVSKEESSCIAAKRNYYSSCVGNCQVSIHCFHSSSELRHKS